MSQPPLRLQGQTGSVPAKTPTRVIPSWPTKEFLAFQPLLLVDWTWYQASIYIARSGRRLIPLISHFNEERVVCIRSKSVIGDWASDVVGWEENELLDRVCSCCGSVITPPA